MGQNKATEDFLQKIKPSIEWPSDPETIKIYAGLHSEGNNIFNENQLIWHVTKSKKL